jgi:periodic tryptophan protein 2
MSDDSDLRWRITQKHFFMQNNAKLSCASYHASTNLLVVGFSNGIFGLYEMPDFNEIHKLRFAAFEVLCVPLF